LKPENILLSFDYKKQEITDLKLCDFGLGAYFDPQVQLTDFCGSPGTVMKTIISSHENSVPFY
jgi:serine/threonine protein kinase